MYYSRFLLVYFLFSNIFYSFVRRVVIYFVYILLTLPAAPLLDFQKAMRQIMTEGNLSPLLIRTALFWTAVLCKRPFFYVRTALTEQSGKGKNAQ